ncbi:hypothetical protein DTO271D3_921 [Paecilomyces variotii]|nr:hypothetical protein DTO271D3_921 [Paecilomyces variotii]
MGASGVCQEASRQLSDDSAISLRRLNSAGEYEPRVSNAARFDVPPFLQVLSYFWNDSLQPITQFSGLFSALQTVNFLAKRRMATTEGPARAHDRHGLRRPFSSWMKRLANLKNSSVSNHAGTSSKRGGSTTGSKSKKCKNNPYPLSGTINTNSRNDRISWAESTDCGTRASRSQSQPSFTESNYDGPVPATSAKSTAPTLSTTAETTISDAGYSKAGTLATTVGGGISSAGGGEGSTFSSPAHSVRSLTTTLTTVQSTAPSAHLYGVQNGAHGGGLPHVSSTQSSASQPLGVQFTHQFPPSPASAVPPHLAPYTYSTATANNMLTDNASILTLASSSKRRRRNSLDTNASVRALAPSSVFGGSRESLPLSVLSGSVVDNTNASVFNASGVVPRPSIGGLAGTERASIYSATGTMALGTSAGDRSSYYANKQSSGTGDTGSIRSGIQSHVRHDSATGSLAGGVGSPLASPVVISSGATGRISRRSSGWAEVTGVASEDEETEGSKDDEESTETQTQMNLSPETTKEEAVHKETDTKAGEVN